MTTNIDRMNALEVANSRVPEECSLSPVAYEERIAMVRREIGPHARSKQRLENGIAWDFDATPEMRAKLEDLARLERDCCSDLDFEVWENPTGTRLRFEISGIDPDSEIFERMGFASGGDAGGDVEGPRLTGSPETRRWFPLMRRGGIAALLSVAVCCVAPIALVSIAGITAAAPLLMLDNPAAITGLTIVFALILWAFENRRRRVAAAAAGEDIGCGC